MLTSHIAACTHEDRNGLLNQFVGVRVLLYGGIGRGLF